MVRKNECARTPDVFQAECASRGALDLIANKWVVLIIEALSSGTLRYGELQRLIIGVSQKMLSQTLRKLEHAGLVGRKVYPVVPPKVEYTLTAVGESLVEPLSVLCEWAEANYAELRPRRAEARHRSTKPL